MRASPAVGKGSAKPWELATMVTAKRDFDKEAATWDVNPVRRKMADDIVGAICRQVVMTPCMEVLDLGCGTGLIGLSLAPLVGSVTGMDSSRGMLDVFEAKARQLGHANARTACCQPGDELPGTYDAIVSSMTLHHVEDIDALLVKMHRALKSPGHLAIADLDLDQGEFHGDNTGVYHHGFDRADLRRRFQAAGFTDVEDWTVATIEKPVAGGKLRQFIVFLMVGRKAAS